MSTTTLGDLVTRLRHEAGHSSSPSTGINQRDQLIYLLNRAQEEIAIGYDFPGLVVDRDTPVVIGSRYYSYPADLPFENVADAWLVWGTTLTRLEYGIGPEQFMLWNSALGFQSWPVQRWQHHSDDGTFELWPVPSEAPAGGVGQQAAVIRMRGTRLIATMVADSDMCVMPATAIVLFAAAELLAREGAKDAELKLAKGKEYLRRLRVRQANHKTGAFVIGGGSDGARNRGRVGLDYIPEGYGSGPGH